jgi:histidinol dehydrogenase
VLARRASYGRSHGRELSAQEAVRRIVREVREQTLPSALLQAFDGSRTRGSGARADVEPSLNEIPIDLREALEFAAGRIRSYEAQARHAMKSYEEGGLGAACARDRRVLLPDVPCLSLLGAASGAGRSGVSAIMSALPTLRLYRP